MTVPALRTPFLAAFFIAVAGLSSFAGTVDVYLSAPFTETAGSSGLPTSDGTPTGTATTPANTPNTLGFTGVSTETFSQTANTYTSLTSTALSNATFTTPGTGFSISANGQYGGGNQGNYLGVNAGNTTTITFNSPVGYFGLLWCAVDAGNSLTIYDQNNAVIGIFNASTFSAKLPNMAGIQITAVNGSKYNTVDYYGQPTGTPTTTGRLNNGEQYAYLNFVATGGTTISKVVESETGAVFESDNYSILTTAPTVTSTSHGNVVYVTTVPEPATRALAVVAGGLMVVFGLRRRLA